MAMTPTVTATKKSKTQEMEDKIEALERANIAALAEVEELEDKLVALNASKQRLLDKRSDVLTEEVVLEFIRKESEAYDPSKVLRGVRCGPVVMRSACHLFNNLSALVKQAIAENEKK